MDKPQARYREVLQTVVDRETGEKDRLPYKPKQYKIVASCPAVLRGADRTSKRCNRHAKWIGLVDAGTVHSCTCGKLFLAIPPAEQPKESAA